MRRVYRIVVLAIMLQGIFVPRTYAWWDGVEHMSGPGPFFGWDIQLRLFCIVETKTTVETPKPGGGTERKTEGEPKTRVFIPPPIGVILSACKAEGEKPPVKNPNGSTSIERTKRQMAFDIGARFVWADDNPEFASGQRISLTTLEPAVSVPLFTRFNKGDVLDVGFGAGVYWVSSTGFPAFHGAFLEPIRLDFHAPFAVRKRPWAAAIPRARLGILVFPGGFERALFAPRAALPERISRDWVKTIAIDFDLEPLMAKLR